MTLQESLKYNDGQIDPDAYTPGSVSGGWVSLADFGEAAAILMIGAMANTAKLDAKLQQAKDAAGTGAKDVAGSAIAQRKQADGAGDEIVTLPVRASALDITNGFTHVRLRVTIAAANVDYGAVMVRAGAGSRPQSNN